MALGIFKITYGLRFVIHIIFLLDSSDVGKPSLILLDFLLLADIVEHLLVYKILGVMSLCFPCKL